MLKELLKPEIEELIQLRKWNDLKGGLSYWAPPEIADLMLDIDKSDRVLLFRILPRDIGAEVFSYLEHEQRDALLKEMTDQETKHLLADLEPDDRTELLSELPAKATRRLLNLLSPEDLKEARQLLGYPDESIGRLMTPEYVTVRPEWTINRVLQQIRTFGMDKETINRIYITDKSGKLLDDIIIRHILLAESDTTVEELMDYSVISVSAFDDQEEAVRTMEKYDIAALPVVDSDGQLVGIVTFDDIFDISEEETTEDFHKISGINPVDQSYLSAGILKLWWKRFPWLFILLFASFVSSAVISLYSDTIKSLVALTFFLPMLIGTAGNTGTQSATLIIRALSIGDIDLSDWLKILFKEFLVGLLLGVVLGAFTFIRGLFDSQGSLELALVVGISMVVLIMWSNAVGTVLPIILEKFGLDPAVVSSPFISTLADVSGIIIYFNLAIWILGI